MNRADRILAVYAGDLSAEELVDLGVTADDALAALHFACLDLELSHFVTAPKMRDIVSSFIADLDLE